LPVIQTRDIIAVFVESVKRLSALVFPKCKIFLEK
jgi:hypothetical protein